MWSQEPNERGFPNFSPAQVPEVNPTAFEPDPRYFGSDKKETIQTDAIQQPPTSQASSGSGATTTNQNDFSRELKRIRDARYKQLQRLMQTDEQKAAQRERKRQKYASESPEQREIRRRRDCERRRLRWQTLPPDIRAQRRQRASLKARERRLKMTPEQKDRKKNRDRENARKRRQRKKLEQNNQSHTTSSESNAGGSALSEVGVGWLAGQPWMNLKVEPEDYSLVTGMQRRY